MVEIHNQYYLVSNILGNNNSNWLS